MPRRKSQNQPAVPFFYETCCGLDEVDARYTQWPNFGDRARSTEQLKSDQIRKPSLSEGLSFREKIII